MANIYKRLGATTVVADTDTLLFLSTKPTVISSISVCNRGGTNSKFRVAHVDANSIGSVADEDFIYFDLNIPRNNTFIFTGGITMAADEVMLVRSESADVNFIAWGTEV